MPRDSVHAFAAAARRWSWVGGLAALWSVGTVLSLAGPIGGPLGLLIGAATLAALAAVALMLRHRVGASALAFLALAAIAASALMFLPMVAPLLAAALVGALLVPLFAGWRVHALELALRSTGRRPRFPFPLAAVHADAIPPPSATARAVARGLPRRHVRGLALLGYASAELFAPAERIHASHAGFDALSLGLASAGAQCEPRGASLHVTLADGRRARVKRGTTLFPDGDDTLDIRGDGAHELRRLLESDLSHLLVFAWSDQGRRWEARLNAMLSDAHVALTLEERSLLLEEAQRVEQLLDARDLLDEEHTRLRGWKAQRLRVHLATKLLSEPVGARTEGRLVAPHPTLAPDLARVLDAGGLSAMKRLVLVPHWIVPVRSSWGEREVLVNALTGRLDPESERLLEATRSRAPSHFVDAPRTTRIMNAPEPTAALLKQLREALGRGIDVSPAASGSADVVLIPFVPAADGYVNAVTGAVSKDLGAPPAIAATA